MFMPSQSDLDPCHGDESNSHPTWHNQHSSWQRSQHQSPDTPVSLDILHMCNYQSLHRFQTSALLHEPVQQIHRLQPFCMNLYNKYTDLRLLHEPVQQIHRLQAFAWTCTTNTQISDFCCKLDDICTLLASYAVYGGNSLLTFRDNLSVLSSRGLRGCTVTSVRNFHHTLCNIPEECRSPRHRYLWTITNIIQLLYCTHYKTLTYIQCPGYERCYTSAFPMCLHGMWSNNYSLPL